MERQTESDIWTFLSVEAARATNDTGSEKLCTCNGFESAIDRILEDMVSPDTTWQHCKELDEILNIGESSSNTPMLREVEDNSEETKELREAPDDETKETVFHVLDELIEAYRDESFQAQLQILLEAGRKLWKYRKIQPMMYVKGREDLVSQVLLDILPKYGFTGLGKGLHELSLTMLPYFQDSDVQEKMRNIDALLDLSPQQTFRELRYYVKLQHPNLVC